MINKKQERHRLQKNIAALNKSYRQQAELEINRQLVDFLRTQPPQPIAIYLSRESEVSTDFIYDWLLKHRWEVYAPKIEGREMVFYRVPHNRSELVWKEYWKIWEPMPNNEATDFNIMIVPLVGYNKYGYRLGHGQGYYDRWLSKYPPKLTIGLAYIEQRANEKLSFNNFDVPLDMIITNKTKNKKL